MASRKGITVLLRSLRGRPYLMPSAYSVASTAHLFHSTRLANKPTMAKSFEFQSETKNLLDIVAKSLYSDQEVNFLLLSNPYICKQFSLFLYFSLNPFSFLIQVTNSIICYS